MFPTLSIRPAKLVLLVWIVLLWHGPNPGAAVAAPYLEAYASSSDAGSSETVTGSSGSIVASRSGSHSAYGMSSSSDATAVAAFGLLKAQSSAHATNDVANSGSSALFRDTVTINAPGIAAGTPGLFSFAMEVEGSLAAETGHATWRLQAGVGIYSRILGEGEVATGVVNGDPFGGTYDSGLWLFRFGEPFVIGVMIDTSTTAGSSDGSGSAIALFGNTATWQGFTAVESYGTHIPITGYTVTSESGVDWSLPVVPEPVATFLLAPGLVGLALARASHTRSRASPSR